MQQQIEDGGVLYGPDWDRPVLPEGFDFDPRYGMDLAALLEVPLEPTPADFADFWRSEYTTMLVHQPEVRITQTDVLDAEWSRDTLYYTSTDGLEVGGWLLYPTADTPSHLEVIGHGYGGRVTPPARADVQAPMGGACFFPCVRGQPALSLTQSIPPVAQQHVVHGVESRHSYVIRGCVHDLWVAATVLQQRFPHTQRLLFRGGSFGGGLGALTLAWDERFQLAVLRDPTFGNQRFRLSVACLGSGKGARERFLQEPQIAETMVYFDSAIAAAYMRQPCFFICSLYDPKVPPPGQFAVWRAHPGPKQLFVKATGHTNESAVETAAADGDVEAFVRQNLALESRD